MNNTDSRYTIVKIAKGNEMITKDQLTERKRGKGGSIVRINDVVKTPPLGKPWTLPAGEYVVCDLFIRRGRDDWKPDQVGVSIGNGTATSLNLSDIVAVR